LRGQAESTEIRQSHRSRRRRNLGPGWFSGWWSSALVIDKLAFPGGSSGEGLLKDAKSHLESSQITAISFFTMTMGVVDRLIA